MVVPSQPAPPAPTSGREPHPASSSTAATTTTSTSRGPDSGSDPDPDPDSYEQHHVHSVYDTIAPHFSSTRHKPWPLVTNFLDSLPAGSLVLDVGCGNGKYLLTAPHLLLLGSDRSPALLALSRAGARPGERADVLVADSLALPFRPRAADAAICIAVVHHFSTPARRREAIAEMLASVRVGGQVLVYVWALEQRGSRRGWDEGGEQDLLVPWVIKGKKGGAADETHQRYYHLYREGELEED
ncbi:related to TRM9 tRNA-methyltransferase modifies uridine residues at the wobble position, partial [Cephalotrichum gorgonifer]